MLKVQSLREMTRDELMQKRSELLDEQFNLRIRKSIKSLDNPLRLRSCRREIALVNTILNEDKIGIHKLADSSVSVLSQVDSKKKEDK